MFRNREEMRPKLGQGHRPVNWCAVIQDVEIGLLRIDNTFATCVLYVCIPDISFFGNLSSQQRVCRSQLQISAGKFVYGSGLTFAENHRR